MATNTTPPEIEAFKHSATTTTTVEHVGRTKTPVVVLDNVLPQSAYESLRDDLRSRMDFESGHHFIFPGKIATLDWAIVDPLLDAVLGNKLLTDIYPSTIFKQREHVRGFATVLCNPGFVHNYHGGSGHKDITAPAAVFHFGYDGVSNAHTAPTKKTGTAFFREKESGLERMTKLGHNVTAFCTKYPRSLRCSHRGHSVENKNKGEEMDTGNKDGGSQAASVFRDSSAFEEMHRVTGEPNRLVLYPQDVLHNAWVENALEAEATATTAAHFPCSPKDGRLAISLFFLSPHGREIVDVLEVVDTEEKRRRLDVWRRLSACATWDKNGMFNDVNGDCALSTTTTVGDGETLRIRGKDVLDHPVLDRGGVTNVPTTTGMNVPPSVRARHFLMTGTSSLTLMNLKLIGAWVGLTDRLGHGCTDCGHCHQTCFLRWHSPSCDSLGFGGSCCCSNIGCGRCVAPCTLTCGEEDKGGALRIQSTSSTVILVDVIFASNIAFSDTGNIFSTVASPKVYFMNMPIPSQIVGFAPKYSCDGGPNDICSEFFEQAPCFLDDTSSSRRVFCSCKVGWQGERRTTKSVCQKCSAGRWSDQIVGVSSDSDCEPCSAGKWSIATGITSDDACTNVCSAGRWSDVSGLSSNSQCKTCSEGKWSTATGIASDTQCTDVCSKGRWSDVKGLTANSQCKLCSAGRWSTATGIASDSNCEPCSAGKWSIATGITSDDACTNVCSAGRWSDVSGLSSNSQCKTCSEGKWSTATGIASDTQCTDVCSKGRWSDVKGLTANSQCKLCSAGKWSNATGIVSDESCKKCGAGYYSTAGEGQISNFVCLNKCSPGKWSSTPGLTADSQCELCSAGKWSGTTGLTSDGACKVCSEGKWSNITGLVADSQCTSCVAGKWSGGTKEVTIDTCIPCDAGKYSKEIGASVASTCSECPAGYFMTTVGSAFCKECEAGKYSFERMKSSICTRTCEITYSSPGSASGCILCSAGKYQDETVSSQWGCKNCVPGLFSPGTAEKCQACPEGKFQPENELTSVGDSACKICPKGYYGPNQASSNCTKFPAGKFYDAEGATHLNDATFCEAGKFSTAGSASCTGCPLGKYGTEVGETSDANCHECDRGMFAISPDLGRQIFKSCTICPVNEYQDLMGQGNCKSCADIDPIFITKGSQAVHRDSKKDCKSPDSGFCNPFQRPSLPGTGDDACQDCPIGQHGDFDGENCFLCPTGFYQDSVAQSDCKKCSSSLCHMIIGATSDAPLPKKLLLQKSSGDDDATAVIHDTTSTQDEENSIFSSFVDSTLKVDPGSLTVYILGSLGATLVILFHRRCPEQIKSVDMFAARHWVEDTHALRMLDTKLGASFSVALVFIVSCICAFVADPSNNFVKTSGLEPGLDRLLDQVTNYSQLTIDVQTFAPKTPSASCGAIKGGAPGGGLVCTTTNENTETFEDLGIKCSFAYECEVQSSIRGTNDFLLELPESVQYIEWEVTSSFWSPDINISHFSSVLTTNSSMNEQPLAGTLEDPTTLSFGTIRSTHEDEFKKATKNALQLFWRGTKKKTGTVSNSRAAAGFYKHYVAFQFQVEENVYITQLQRKLNFSSMFSVLIAYTLTALSVLGTAKMFVQKGIDSYFRRRANKVKVPSDVLRRERILDEHLITKGGSRRLSMSVDGSRSAGREKPQKHRRLSSQEQDETASMVDIGIEMTTNPIFKDRAKGVGKRRRHTHAYLSTSLNPLEQKTTKTDDEIKQKVKKMELEFEKQSKQVRQMKEKLEKQSKQIQMLLAAAAFSQIAAEAETDDSKSTNE